MGRETFRTGDKILMDIVENKSPEVSPGDIVSRHVTESTKRLVKSLWGRGGKRARETGRVHREGQSKIRKKRARIIKRVFSLSFLQSHYVCRGDRVHK